MTIHRILQPRGWPLPKGYSHGIITEGGRQIYVGGQIGWDASGRFAGEDLVSQAGQALRNVLAVLEQAGAGPEHVVRLTWYVTDLDAYRASQKELGRVYRETFGQIYPAMSLVQVAGLVEAKAKVEIEATAVMPH